MSKESEYYPAVSSKASVEVIATTSLPASSTLSTEITTGVLNNNMKNSNNNSANNNNNDLRNNINNDEGNNTVKKLQYADHINVVVTEDNALNMFNYLSNIEYSKTCAVLSDNTSVYCTDKLFNYCAPCTMECTCDSESIEQTLESTLEEESDRASLEHEPSTNINGIDVASKTATPTNITTTVTTNPRTAAAVQSELEEHYYFPYSLPLTPVIETDEVDNYDDDDDNINNDDYTATVNIEINPETSGTLQCIRESSKYMNCEPEQKQSETDTPNSTAMASCRTQTSSSVLSNTQLDQLVSNESNNWDNTCDMVQPPPPPQQQQQQQEKKEEEEEPEREYYNVLDDDDDDDDDNENDYYAYVGLIDEKASDVLKWEQSTEKAKQQDDDNVNDDDNINNNNKNNNTRVEHNAIKCHTDCSLTLSNTQHNSRECASLDEENPEQETVLTVEEAVLENYKKEVEKIYNDSFRWAENKIDKDINYGISLHVKEDANSNVMTTVEHECSSIKKVNVTHSCLSYPTSPPTPLQLESDDHINYTDLREEHASEELIRENTLFVEEQCTNSSLLSASKPLEQRDQIEEMSCANSSLDSVENTLNKIPRVYDELLHTQRELIGRGGDRGSSVYRLSEKQIPLSLKEQISHLHRCLARFSSMQSHVYENYCTEAMSINNLECDWNAHSDKSNNNCSNNSERDLALKIYPRPMLYNEVEFAEVFYQWQTQHSNKSCCIIECHNDRNNWHTYREKIQNNRCLLEQLYAAQHLVISYALVINERNENCGILMPLYICNLKTYLERNEKREKNNVCKSKTYCNNNVNNGNANINNSNISNHNLSNSISSRDENSCCTYMDSSNSSNFSHIGEYDIQKFVCHTITNSRTGSVDDDTDACAHDSNTESEEPPNECDTVDESNKRQYIDTKSANHYAKRKEAFCYSQRYTPIYSMYVITAICFQLLEAITFMNATLGKFYNECFVSLEEKERRQEQEQRDLWWEEQECHEYKENEGVLKHYNGFTHNDIHVSNILLSEQGSVALCDFELVSRSTENIEHVENRGYRLPPYSRQSPFGVFSPESDTWAFGLIVVNLLTGVDPLFSNKKIMNDFGSGPLLMAYNSSDRGEGVEVLDWEANIKHYVDELLLLHNLCNNVDTDITMMRELLHVCSLCLVNRPNAKSYSPSKLLQLPIFAPFRTDLTLAERIVKDWLEQSEHEL